MRSCRVSIIFGSGGQGKVCDNARPHPGLLPRGEGETVAAYVVNQAAGLAEPMGRQMSLLRRCVSATATGQTQKPKSIFHHVPAERRVKIKSAQVGAQPLGGLIGGTGILGERHQFARQAVPVIAVTLGLHVHHR